MQWLFLIAGFNKENEEMKQDTSKNTEQSNKVNVEQQKQRIIEMVKERRGY
ncbi:hypothetical protein [Virgibacillus sp. SK37]|uniref:hypothetical protein n=1 Tax=Virgibacillus sp. SK37 TaxID=403957 RepID=UPI0004D0B20B|nr:hypothetical protein [Virgibacillus sp. SK37]AIF45642.1 hypothetical protein X953_18800 [Virgibacillus sp. SK37]